MKEFCPNCKKEFDKKAIEKYEALVRSSVGEKVTLKIDKKMPVTTGNGQSAEFRRVPAVSTGNRIETAQIMAPDGGATSEIRE